jgi:hypothetical protein
MVMLATAALINNTSNKVCDLAVLIHNHLRSFPASIGDIASIFIADCCGVRSGS